MLEHRTRIHHLKQMQKLLKKRLIVKTEEELLVQDKEIKKRIARKGLSPDEQANVDTVATAECDIESFF